jgi:hypothetical protein
MPTVTCVALAAALLEVAAGLGKLRHPGGFSTAAARVGFSLPPPAVRALALVEVLAAVLALSVGGAEAWAAVAASYVAFTVFAVMVRERSGGVGSCGCFGRAQAPVSPLHLAVTAVGALVTVLAALGGASGLTVTTAVPAAVVAFLGYSVLVVLPPVRAAARAVGRA